VQPSVDEKGRAIERTAADILRHYERMNRAVGKDRDAVTRLLRIREAVDAKNAGRADVALDVSFGLRDMFFYSLIPFAADHGVNGSDPSGWRCSKDYTACGGVQGLA
jgi:hypothetical protein